MQNPLHVTSSPQPALASLLAQSSWLERLARRLVADPGAADDLVQETWLEVARRPRAEVRSPRGFLASVLRSKHLTRQRSGARRRAREQSVARSEQVNDTTGIVQKAELQKNLTEHVLALDEPYRTVVLLKFFEDLSPLEIAKRLERPQSSVNTQLSRGLEKLRERLDGEYGNRRAWCVALAPLTVEHELVAAGALAAGLPWLLVPVLAALAFWGLGWPGSAGEVADAEIVRIDAVPEIADGEPVEEVGVFEVAEREREELSVAPRTPEVRTAPRPTETLTFEVVDIAGRPQPGVVVEKPPTNAAYFVGEEAVYGREWHANGWSETSGTRSELGARLRMLRSTYEHSAATGHAIVPWDELGVTREEFEILERWADGEDVELTYPRDTSDASGRVELTVERGQGGDIRILGELDLIGQARIEDEERGRRELLIVAHTRTLQGIVQDEDGQPLDDAQLSIGLTIEQHPDFPWPAATHSNYRSWKAEAQDGKFVLEGVPRISGLRIVAIRHGYLPGELRLDADETGPYVITLRQQPTPRTISGRVFLEDGSPADGVSVQLGQDEDSTNEHGEFVIEISSLGEGAALTAFKPGLTPALIPAYADELQADTDSRSGLVLRMGAATQPLTGRVEDHDGSALPLVFVAVIDPTVLGTSDRCPEAKSTHTDSEGAFKLDGYSAREYHLRVVDEQAKRVVVAGPFVPGNEAVVRFPEVDETFELEGRVIDQAGTPLEGVEVTQSIYKALWEWGSSGRSWSDIDVETVHTDADGRFRIRGAASEGALSFKGVDLDPRHISLQDFDTTVAVHEYTLEAFRRFRIELDPAEDIDAYEFRDAGDTRHSLKMKFPDMTMFHNRVRPASYKLVPVCEVDTRANTLVLFRAGSEVRRVPLAGVRGELTVVRP